LLSPFGSGRIARGRQTGGDQTFVVLQLVTFLHDLRQLAAVPATVIRTDEQTP